MDGTKRLTAGVVTKAYINLQSVDNTGLNSCSYGLRDGASVGVPDRRPIRKRVEIRSSIYSRLKLSRVASIHPAGDRRYAEGAAEVTNKREAFSRKHLKGGVIN